jgi:putative ABC transport system ATP-binding protein
MLRHSTTPPVLTTDRASLVFGEGVAAFRAVSQVSLEVYRGELLLLMGPSGSGKTSILQLIGGLASPTGGEIYVEDQALSKLDKNALAILRLHRFGFIFQDYHLLRGLRAWENVAIAFDLLKVKSQLAEARSRALLTAMGVGARADAFPSELSGGQKQRVAIARALAGDPDILLADEPTAALDSQNGERVIELLSTLARRDGRAVVVATHDRRMASFADRIIYLEDGKTIDRPKQSAPEDAALV